MTRRECPLSPGLTAPLARMASQSHGLCHDVRRDSLVSFRLKTMAATWYRDRLLLGRAAHWGRWGLGRLGATRPTDGHCLGLRTSRCHRRGEAWRATVRLPTTRRTRCSAALLRSPAVAEPLGQPATDVGDDPRGLKAESSEGGGGRAPVASPLGRRGLSRLD